MVQVFWTCDDAIILINNTDESGFSLVHFTNLLLTSATTLGKVLIAFHFLFLGFLVNL